MSVRARYSLTSMATTSDASLSSAAAAATRARSIDRWVAVMHPFQVARARPGWWPARRVPGVEVVLVDVLDHAVGDEVPDRLGPLDALPAVGRRDRHRGHLFEGDPVRGQARVGEHMPGSGHPDELGQVNNSSSTSFHEKMCANASAPVMKKSSASGRWACRSRRVSIVYVRAVAVDVDPAHREPRVRRRRDDGHQVAVFGRRHRLGVLLPGLAGGDEDDLVEPEERLDLAGCDG